MQTNLSVQDTASWTFNKLIFSWLAALFHSIGANVVGLGWGHLHRPSAAPEMREDVVEVDVVVVEVVGGEMIRWRTVSH